jgi:hypothetical protein
MSLHMISSHDMDFLSRTDYQLIDSRSSPAPKRLTKSGTCKRMQGLSRGYMHTCICACIPRLYPTTKGKVRNDMCDRRQMPEDDICGNSLASSAMITS